MKKFVILTAVVGFSLAYCGIEAFPIPSSSMIPSETQYNQRSDGYIYKGTITLTRIVSKKQETFYLFNKDGIDYVAKSKNGPYYRLARRMKINNVEYTY